MFGHNEYGDALDPQWDIIGDMMFSSNMDEYLESPVTVLGRGQSQTDYETNLQAGTMAQWWNVSMGYYGYPITGNAESDAT